MIQEMLNNIKFYVTQNYNLFISLLIIETNILSGLSVEFWININKSVLASVEGCTNTYF